MKNRLATYLSVLAMAFVALSCSWDDDNEANTPYAYVKSFGIGDIKSEYPAFTDAGKDTSVVKTISGSSWKFTIDQVAGKIFNVDSLPFSTNLSKVAVEMTVEGIASIYDTEADEFELMSTSDSIDFTNPRILRITSLDGSYYMDYTVSVNAHKVDPDKMVWSKVTTPSGIVPERVVEFNDEILLFGNSSEVPMLFSNTLDGKAAWAPVEISGLPATVDFSTVTPYCSLLCVLAEGDLYTSADARNWNCTSQDNGLLAIVGASDDEPALWLASATSLYCSSDGEAVERVAELPADFPLYGISKASYPLSHNKNIVRYMLVGYSTSEKDGKPQVWSMLSNENKWVKYDNAGNIYPCPALEGLAVLHYGGFLYAFGGNGTVAGSDVEAFSSFYISKDNGIVWKASEDYYQVLPETLNGKNVCFAATVDSNNFMWIVTSDAVAGAWRGIINRLGFNK